MSMEIQKRADYHQPDLFEAVGEVHPVACRNGGTAEMAAEAKQLPTATPERRVLVVNLMERIVNPTNLLQAAQAVRSNKGSAGVDGMSTGELPAWLTSNLENLREQLLGGTFQPQAVRGVLIPKPGGGQRQLGIPTVIDRLVQQAIYQQLEPILDPQFSGSSYGFRLGRNAKDAVLQAKAYVEQGRSIVVDIDLEKFFDRVNHDILMARLARHIGDKVLLALIRRFLTAGMLQDDEFTQRDEGTPQGGPLSPLLANLLLDDLDKELERRGHSFCRYADDCNIYVRSVAAGQRVLKSVTQFLEKRLRLKVNQDKSAVAPSNDRQFLGFRLTSKAQIAISTKAQTRYREKIRKVTAKPMGPYRKLISRVNQIARGWVDYYSLSAWENQYDTLTKWTRRRLRAVMIRRLKTPRALRRFLISMGVSPKNARQTASSGKGRWRLSETKSISFAMSNAWFEEMGYECMVLQYRTAAKM